MEGQMAFGSLTMNEHLSRMAVGVVFSLILGFLLSRTSAQLPYLDALTTVFGIIATLMMVHYVRANWLYWIGIDLASVILYARRQMWPTVLLYLVYTVMALYAYLNWGG
jgi:nicotinamide mononucleotide transporter